MHGAHNTCRNAFHTLRKKMHMHPCMCACETVKKILCHGSYRELILSLVRASCRFWFAARPDAVSTKSVARCCSLKKSVQIHASSWRGRCCGVAQASFDHLHWCSPHPVCVWFALEAWPRGSPHQKFYSCNFSREFRKKQEFLEENTKRVQW